MFIRLYVHKPSLDNYSGWSRPMRCRPFYNKFAQAMAYIFRLRQSETRTWS